MPRLSSAEQLEAFRQQQIDLAKKIREAERKARDKQRDDEQRRETLVGRVVLHHVATNPDSELAKAMAALLSTQLTKPADRTLFQNLSEAPPPAPLADQPLPDPVLEAHAA